MESKAFCFVLQAPRATSLSSREKCVSLLDNPWAQFYTFTDRREEPKGSATRPGQEAGRTLPKQMYCCSPLLTDIHAGECETGQRDRVRSLQKGW